MNRSQPVSFSRKLGVSTLTVNRRNDGNYDISIYKQGRTLTTQDISLACVRHIIQNLQNGNHPF